MRIISWNVNGIRAAARKGLDEWFRKDDPDILCVQETKALPGQVAPGLLHAEDRHSFWNNPDRKGYAGVAVFSKAEPLEVLTDFGPDRFDTEGRALILKYPEFVLVNVYFPNGGASPERLRYKLEFYDRFLALLDDLDEDRILIGGDVNTAHKEIDLARPRENRFVSGFLPEERAWVDRLVKQGFEDTFRHFDKGPGKYTWWDYKTGARERNVGWRIDYFFASRGLMPVIKDAFILDEVRGSDHCPIGVEMG
jgi:exodeoxyribonuclease-3